MKDRDELIERLKETARLHEEFASVLAHDLRNPLGAILTSTQLLLGREPNERDKRPLLRILGSARRMAAMIDQLTDFAQVRAEGGFSLARQRCELSEMCVRVLVEIDERERIRIESRGDLSGSWDPDRLGRAILHLITGARAHVDASTLVLDADGTKPDVELRLEIGAAIAQNVLPELFEPMSGASDRRTRRGLGVSLYIAREIFLAHGGALECAASPEATIFIARLPRA